MSKLQFWSVLCLLFCCQCLFSSDKVIAIRFTDTPPGDQQWATADMMTGFVIPGKATVANFQTEARLLFDQQKLYLNLLAKQYFQEDNLDHSLFSDNNFEIFLQPDPQQPRYFQIAVSEAGKIYSGVMRNKADIPGIEHQVTRTTNGWRLLLSVPLTSLGLQADATETEIRFNLCRHNRNFPGNKPEVSSFAVLDSYDYHVADSWRTAVLTRKAGEPRTWHGHSERIAVNLLSNPEFDDALDGKPLGWGIMRDGVTWEETMAMSGEWIIRATGNSYNFMNRGVNLKEGEDYTLKVKARKYGEEGTFGVIQSVRRNGRIGEGTYSAWQIPLSDNFHEYFIPLKADPGVVSLAFYRIGSRTNTSGIDIAAVHLYRGKVSSFEIRKITRAGCKKLVPGTVLPRKENPYGRTANTLKVLALMMSQTSVSEVLEIFTGLNVDMDCLCTTGKNQDVYYTDQDPAQIQERLEANAYDVYLVGKQVPVRVGKELAARICTNVEAGKGLWINNSREHGPFRELVKKFKPVPVKADHYLKQGLPLELFPLPAASAGKSRNPLETILVADLSQGRIILSDTAASTQQFKIRMHSDAYSYWLFPYDRHTDAWLARMAFFAAGQKTLITSINCEGGKAQITIQNPLPGSTVQWQLLDKNGEFFQQGNSPAGGSSLTLTLPPLQRSGNHLLTVWLRDQSQAVLDYSSQVIQQGGPEITDFQDLQRFYSGTQPGRFALRVKDFQQGMQLSWELEDFSGRVIQRGNLPAAEQVEFQVPLAALFTNLGRLRIALQSGDSILDYQRFPVYVQDRDKARLWQDFTPSIWNAGSETSMEAADNIASQLEKIGFRSYLMPLQGGASVLNSGMGLGGSYLGGGDNFCSLYPPKDHVRRPSLNDPAIRNRIAERAQRNAASERHFGVVNTSVCDEPNLVSPNSSFEVDAHPENLKEYRRRMQSKYGSIEKFNARCETAYKSFEEIGMVTREEARSRSNFAEFIEWREYNVDRWVETIRLVSDGGKKGDPGSALSLYNSFGQMAMSGNDYWKLLTRGGLGFSHEYTSMVYMGTNPLYDFDEFYRSFRPDLRVWGFTGYFGSRQRALFEPWWFALHRYGGFCWFAVGSGVGPGGGGRWLNMLDLPSYGYTEDAANVQHGLEKSALLDGLGKLFLDYDWQKREVAIMYSHPSLLVSYCLSKETRGLEIHNSGPLHDYYHSRHRVRYLLEELLYQYDFVAPEQIQNGILDSYKVIFLPGIRALSDADVQKLQAFAARGGMIVSDFQPGEYDELGVKRAALPLVHLPASQLLVIGKLFNDKDVAQKELFLKMLQEAGAAPIMQCENVASFSGREAMHFTDDQMHVYAILRNFTRGSDSEEQKFTLPTSGYLYDMRKSICLGKTSSFACKVPNAEAVIYGHFPYQIEAIEVAAPQTVQAGSDLAATIRIKTNTGAPAGKHVFHVELLPPSGESRFFMRRNLTAPNGQLDFSFRMAFNDPPGNWRLLIKDVLSGMTREHPFVLKK